MSSLGLLTAAVVLGQIGCAPLQCMKREPGPLLLTQAIAEMELVREDVLRERLEGTLERVFGPGNVIANVAVRAEYAGFEEREWREPKGDLPGLENRAHMEPGAVNRITVSVLINSDALGKTDPRYWEDVRSKVYEIVRMSAGLRGFPEDPDADGASVVFAPFKVTGEHGSCSDEVDTD